MKKKETEFLTEEEAQAMLRAPDRRTLQGKRDYAILLTLVTTGLRKAEICGLKFRRIPLNSGTLLALKDYLKATGNGTNPAHPLFQTLGKHGPYQERGLTHKSVDRLTKSVVKKALIQKRVHPHVMRHTFVTTLLDNGNDLKTVQALMGHSHIRTTERYLHSTDDRKVGAIQSL